MRAFGPHEAGDTARIIAEAEARSGNGEEGVRRRKAQVAAGGKRRTGADAGPVHEGEGGKGQRLEGGAGRFHHVVIGLRAGGVRPRGVEIGNVGPAREGQRALTPDHRRADVAAASRLGGEVRQRLPHAARDGIAALGIGQDETGDAALHGDENGA